MEKELYIKTALVELVQEGDESLLIQNYQPANQDPLNQDRWWITKERFKETYTKVAAVFPDSTERFDFGTAIAYMKEGKRVARGGWNGKGMWLLMQVPDENSKMTHPYIYIEYPAGHPAYPQGSRVPWLASQTDMLAEDWEVVE